MGAAASTPQGHVLILGGTGFIGTALSSVLVQTGYGVTAVSRSPETALLHFQQFPWGSAAIAAGTLTAGGYPTLSKQLDGAAAVVNLAGAGIADRPWTSAYKQTIRNSRVQSCATLMQALGECKTLPPVLLQGSAVGYYGDTGDTAVDESAPAGSGFLAETAQAWEAASAPAEAMGMRRVLIRTGVVLDQEGGALGKMLPAYKFFLGGPLGNGRQWFPWIHRQDEVGAIMHCLTNSSVRGPVNCVSPNPVQNEAFCQTLASVLKRPCALRAPAAMLRLLLGDMARDMLLASQHIQPTALLRSGYAFAYPTLEQALRNIFTV